MYEMRESLKGMKNMWKKKDNLIRIFGFLKAKRLTALGKTVNLTYNYIYIELNNRGFIIAHVLIITT